MVLGPYAKLNINRRCCEQSPSPLVNCPTQSTCIAHCDLCICQLYFITNPQWKYERNTAGQLATSPRLQSKVYKRCAHLLWRVEDQTKRGLRIVVNNSLVTKQLPLLQAIYWVRDKKTIRHDNNIAGNDPAGKVPTNSLWRSHSQFSPDWQKTLGEWCVGVWNWTVLCDPHSVGGKMRVFSLKFCCF